jgi:predicted phosphate transport protein (TIGR00153 family)
MFAEMATNLCDGARLLKGILDDFQNVEVRVQNLKDLEHRGDEMTHSILVKLNQTFITPFDRDDIHALATAMDDVLDFIYAAGERLVMYKIVNAPGAASELAAVIIRQTEQLQKAVASLERHDNVLQICVEINRLENDADHLARTALATLFDRERDPIALIKPPIRQRMPPTFWKPWSSKVHNCLSSLSDQTSVQTLDMLRRTWTIQRSW